MYDAARALHARQTAVVARPAAESFDELLDAHRNNCAQQFAHSDAAREAIAAAKARSDAARAVA